jgi:hypothetical protein
MSDDHITQAHLGTSHYLDTYLEEIDAMTDLASRLLDMVERVEWVRRTGGTVMACPFCHAISERDDGPGHLEDCEWLLATREGNRLRMVKLLR